MKRNFTSNYKSNLAKALKSQFKQDQEYTNVFKFSEDAPGLLSYTETEYTKGQRDLRRLEKMDNKILEAYKFEDSTGEILTIFAPLRLHEQLQTEAKEKLGDRYITITKTK